MKTLSIFLLFLAASIPAGAVTTLWTKTLSAETHFSYMVGSDGSVLIVDGVRDDVRTIYWIARSGEILAEIEPESPRSPHSPIYVTEDEAILSGNGMALYQRLPFDQIEHTHLPQGVLMHQSRQPISYPYFILSKTVEEGTEFTLLDLTSENAVRVVGEAVIGIHGKNLKVRWKSVVNAKYKVQFSTDLNSWTDYTEVMDGTGATIIVNIPIDEDSAAFYARVIKL